MRVRASVLAVKMCRMEICRVSEKVFVEKLQKFDDQEFHDMMQLNESNFGGAAVDMQDEGTADNMQDALDIILCNDDRQSQQHRQSQQQVQSQQQPATAMASGTHDTDFIS